MYHYNFNHHAAKAKPLYEVRDPPPATQNSRAYKPNYNNHIKKRKQPLYKCFKLQYQQRVNIGLLQRTAADMQNTANTSAAYQVQLSSSVSSQLDNIIKILNTNFTCIDGDLKKLFCNQNLIYNTMESRHQKFE